MQNKKLTNEQIQTKKAKRKILSIGFAPHDGMISLGVSPHGFISIGIIPHGVVSIGLVPMGVLAVGFVSMGLLSIGTVSMGLIGLGQNSMSIVQFMSRESHQQEMIDSEGNHHNQMNH